MVRRWFIVASILASMVMAANAQPPGLSDFGGFISERARLLIDLDEVRKELRVNNRQAELLDALQEDLVEQRLAISEEDEGPRSADAAIELLRDEYLTQKLANFDRRSETLIAVVLEPRQANRLSELYLQRDGIRAFERPEVVTKLELSEDQKKRLRTLRETFVDKRPILDSAAQQRKQREKEEQALAELLSDEQRTRWQELRGKPFEFPTAP